MEDKCMGHLHANNVVSARFNYAARPQFVNHMKISLHNSVLHKRQQRSSKTLFT